MLPTSTNRLYYCLFIVGYVCTSSFLACSASRVRTDSSINENNLSAPVRRSRRRKNARIAAISNDALSKPSRLDRTDASLRDRFVNLWEHKIDDYDSRRGAYEYYYQMEILTDKLLGIEEPEEKEISTITTTRAATQRPAGLLRSSWTPLVGGVAAAAIVIVSAAFFTSTASLAAVMAKRILLLSNTVKGYSLMGLESGKLYLHAIRRIGFVKLSTKILRKCFILEVWRQIWIRVYKATRFVWKGTTSNILKVYVKFTPAWIRRGLKATFQTTVQGHVHGAVGSALGGISMQSFFWQRSSAGGIELDEAVIGGGTEGALDTSSVEGAFDGGADSVSETLHSTGSSVVDVAAESSADAVAQAAVESAAQSTIEGAVDAAAEEILDVADDALVEAVLESTTEFTIIEASVESIMDTSDDALAQVAVESAHSAIESAVDTVADVAVETAAQSAMESAMDAVAPDVLAEVAVEAAIESAMDSAADDIAEAAVESAIESAIDSAADDIAEAAVESVIESAIDSAADDIAEAAVESVIESAIDSAADDIAEVIVESAIENIIDVAADEVAEAVVESAIESTIDTIVHDTLP